MGQELIARMQKLYQKMSKGQRKLTNYILKNFDKAVFLTARELGEEVKISESTVVRYATMLGYGCFMEFHKALEDVVSEKLHSIKKIEISSSQKMSDIMVLENVMKADAEKVRLTYECISRETFIQALEIIQNAKKIYILGIRSCAPLASFLGFYLGMMFDDVCMITTNNSSEILEQMIRINEKDCIIGISFPRYSMRTLKALEFANDRNAKIITLTDSKNSPISLYSSCNLIARSDMASIVDSLVAPLSVINALIVALCIKKQDKVAANLNSLENVWNEYQVYGTDEINMINNTKILKTEE